MAAVTMDTGMFIFCACACAHIHCCLSIKWVDQGVVYPIRLSGLFSYPASAAWLRNKSVRIIEVLLIVAKCPDFAGTVPIFGPLSRLALLGLFCPGLLTNLESVLPLSPVRLHSS